MAVARKTRWLMTGLVAAALAALAIFIGVTDCKSTPSRFEARFYDINTNLLPRVMWVTKVGVAGSRAQSAGRKTESAGSGEQGAGGDDAADALRYLVASMPRRAGFLAV